jgi:2-oxoisovalerate dehydrogenase E1 component
MAKKKNASTKNATKKSLGIRRSSSAPRALRQKRTTPKQRQKTQPGFEQLYRAILFPRLIEERMLLLLRQGRVSKWFSGIGQEAIAVGATLALDPDEYILPLHRNLGVFTSRNVPLWRLIAQWQAKETGFTKGRDRSFHFGSPEHHIVGMISHLGPQLAVADGIALASKLRREKKITLVFTGEGGTSEGDFHEALNVAAVWKLPVIFIIENNGYGLSTPVQEQYACKQLSDRASGYGIEGATIDGNNFVEVYSTVQKYAESIRKNPRPVLLECMTFRMRGHEEASGTKYVPKKLFDEWAKRDPIALFEKFLDQTRSLSKKVRQAIREELLQEIEQSIERAFAEPDVEASEERELEDVYALTPELQQEEAPGTEKEMRFVDAVSDGLREGMRRDQHLVLMGQDIAEYGGVFKVTEGFVKEFGKERVRNTPICESAIVGAALGLSIKGIPSVVEMQFADFVASGFNQVVNNLAKVHYRWGQPARVVVRMPTGAGTGAGPFHSQSNEAWFTHTPGLRVVYPSNPYDAKGLLLTSLAEQNPVMFFEHKALYRSISGAVPEGYYTVPFGRASLVRPGEQAVIITYGAGVQWATKLLDQKPELSVAVLDLRTLVPLDYAAIEEHVCRTGRVLILHEDTLFGGFGGEIAAHIGEKLFAHLDAPVTRVASLDTPVPFASALEKEFLASSRLEQALHNLLSY